MKLKRTLLIGILFLGCIQLTAQTEQDQITKTLMDYIDGTANGQPDRVRNAFHEDLNLYSVAGDSLKVWYGQDYVNRITQGKKSNRIGKIISIDIENDAAMAKIEILMPAYKRKYTDYLMLLKFQGHWKIIHKSYTYVNYPE